ncbi:MAG: NAD-dependent epimerase/dehydratase family protein [Pseudomonadales bacterium]
MHAVVAGASGFIGSHLVSHLSAAGARVSKVGRVGGARPPGYLAPGLLEPDVARIEAALDGVDVVYLIAGMAHGNLSGREAAELEAVNVAAPLRWHRAAVRAGVPRFVWLSSIKVLGEHSARPLRPDDPYAAGDAYARSKAAAEQRLRAQDAGATALCIVRPPLVYGPGVGANFLELLRWADSGWLLPLGSARAPRSMVAVGNLCSLLLRLAAAGSGTFHVADGADWSTEALITGARQLLGRPRRLLPVSPRLARIAAKAMGRQAQWSRLFLPLQVDQSDTQRHLGWQPPGDPEQALEETVTWFRTQR